MLVCLFFLFCCFFAAAYGAYVTVSHVYCVSGRIDCYGDVLITYTHKDDDGDDDDDDDDDGDDGKEMSHTAENVTQIVQIKRGNNKVITLLYI